MNNEILVVFQCKKNQSEWFSKFSTFMKIKLIIIVILLFFYVAHLFMTKIAEYLSPQTFQPFFIYKFLKAIFRTIWALSIWVEVISDLRKKRKI